MLIIRSLDSGEERELLPQMNAFDIHQWSPDGRSFLTWGQDRKDHRGFYQIDAQTGAVTPLLQHEPGNSHQVPRWSPDGKELFFMIRDNTAKTQRLLRRNIETGQEQELFRTNFPASFSYVLSPDGKQIALNLSRQQLKIMPVAGGEARELLRLTEEESRQFTWTADGRHLIFDKAKVNEPTKNELWRIPIEGGAPQKLGIAMEKIGGLYMHPDGRRIVFAAGSRSKQEVWVMENFLPAAQAQKASVSRR
jgi:Tol biopolymer transport system component